MADLQKFINEIDYNDSQKTILNNLRFNKLYLIDITDTNNSINIIILGDARNNTREQYTVSFNKTKGNFACNCKDFQFRARFKNIVCKHISFIVCKVLKILDHEQVLLIVRIVKIMYIKNVWKFG